MSSLCSTFSSYTLILPLLLSLWFFPCFLHIGSPRVLNQTLLVDAIFKATLSPIAQQAARTLARIRRRERSTTWTAAMAGENIFPGMMFGLARQRVEKHSDVWRILSRMPKGALLHAHLDAMVDCDWLIEQVLAEKGLCLLASEALDNESVRQNCSIQIRYVKPPVTEGKKAGKAPTIWTSDYQTLTSVPITIAAETFPDGGCDGFRAWLMSRCVISQEESLDHHQGQGAIWNKFASCFHVIGWMLFYEPIFRRAMQRMLGQLVEDGISYVDFRMAFVFDFRLECQRQGEQGKYLEFLRVFDEEIQKFKKTDAGTGFHGARMIWTVIRSLENSPMAASMRECIRVKQAMPHVICGFDYVGQEDSGRSLADLVPITFWFKKQCVQAGVEIPFFFHAGECLGDGDATDCNLYDAILLGTRRIGHGYSLYKHPLLLEMVKDRKILVESCPISNEILRLNSSVPSHPLPALLSRGVAVSLNNDDPAILGHGKNGLNHDFWQTFTAFENLGLEGLATMAENSIRWSAIEDQKQVEWLKEITEGYLGNGTKAKRLEEWRKSFEEFCQWIIMEFPLEEDDNDDEG
jgi:adenosine deaminase CECR1